MIIYDCFIIRHFVPSFFPTRGFQIAAAMGPPPGRSQPPAAVAPLLCPSLRPALERPPPGWTEMSEVKN